jgi:hypothetical protein
MKVLLFLIAISSVYADILWVSPGSFSKAYEYTCSNGDILTDLWFESFNGTIDYYVYPPFSSFSCNSITAYYTDYSKISVTLYNGSTEELIVVPGKTCFGFGNPYLAEVAVVNFTLSASCVSASSSSPIRSISISAIDAYGAKPIPSEIPIQPSTSTAMPNRNLDVCILLIMFCIAFWSVYSQ